MVPRLRERERGAAAVEFALVFVLMASMLLALIEGGIIFMHQASVSAAAREAARMMAITNEVADASTAAEDAYPFGALDSVVITPSGGCPEPLDRTKEVQVLVTATPTFSLGILGFDPQLKGVGAMRCGG